MAENLVQKIALPLPPILIPACCLSYLTRYIALPSSDLVASALKLNKEELILSEPTNHILLCLALHRALTLLLLPL